MFYLKEFFKLLKDNLFLGFLCTLSTVGMLTVPHFNEEIKAIASIDKKVNLSPYFNALISGKINLSSVTRRMEQLPGVVSVTQVKNSGLTKEIGELKAKFGQEMIAGLTSLSYQQIKISVNQGLEKKNQNLIQEYLARLVGKSSVTMGHIKTPKKFSIDKSDPLALILKYIDFFLIGFFGILFTLSTILLAKPLKDISYIIQRFQRKDFVNIKIYFSGLAVFMTLTLAALFSVKASFQYTVVLTSLFIAIVAGLTLLRPRLRK